MTRTLSLLQWGDQEHFSVLICHMFHRETMPSSTGHFHIQNAYLLRVGVNMLIKSVTLLKIVCYMTSSALRTPNIRILTIYIQPN